MDFFVKHISCADWICCPNGLRCRLKAVSWQSKCPNRITHKRKAEVQDNINAFEQRTVSRDISANLISVGVDAVRW